MKKHLLKLVIFSALWISSYSAADSIKPKLLDASSDVSKKIKLVFAGDIMQHADQIKTALVAETGKYDYTKSFQYITPIISGADLSAGNLETTLAGPPYTGYPAFSSPASLLDALKLSGFNFLVTANNHSSDYGLKGINGTVDSLQASDIEHTGIFKDHKSRFEGHPAIIVRNGITFALLNYTYGTNSKTPGPALVNQIDRKVIQEDLAKALEKKPDFVIVFLHWGEEYKRMQSSSQKEIAKLCFENGADLVVGAHPHVVQPIEAGEVVFRGRNKKVLTAYSLGNFISSQNKRYTDGGITLSVELVRGDDGLLTISKYGYTPVWRYRGLIDKKKVITAVPVYLFENGVPPFPLDASSRAAMNVFAKDTRELLKGIPEHIPAAENPTISKHFGLE